MHDTSFGGPSTTQWLMMGCTVYGLLQDTVPWVIQIPLKHVKVKASHSSPETLQGDPFLPGLVCTRDRLVSGITVNCLGWFILFQESLLVSRRSSSCCQLPHGEPEPWFDRANYNKQRQQQQTMCCTTSKHTDVNPEHAPFTLNCYVMPLC